MNLVNFFSVLSVVVLLSACGAQVPTEQTSESFDSAIVHGQKLRVDSDLSHMVVAIVSELPQGEALCTGSIISKNLILTAAHCVDHNPTKVKIIFASNIKKANADQLRDVTAIYQNPYWNKMDSAKKGDLAILQFDGKLPVGFSPVHFASTNFKLKAGDAVVFAGYGVTNGQRHSGSGVLRTTKTQVIEFKSETEVVTDGRRTSVCFGDSGGPAFSLINGQMVQWGVASEVLNQSCNQASIHTALIEYQGWIQAAIKNL